ncbi:MAG TPA: polysaccharide deacetylase family protein [Candidatus Solibacter sp.]|nr:polysaccharide deacetylase family protein [Candidatus Solibacter sp.]
MKRYVLFARWLHLVLSICLPPLAAQAQQRGQIAITVDDLPTHGLMPPGMTRSEIARNMIAAFKAKGIGPVYGFVNGEKLDGDWDKANVLKIWTDAGFLLGNHTYSHMDITSNSAAAFEEDIVENEGTLEGFMGGRDWHWFRYPYLNEGDTLAKRHAVRNYLRERGYRVAQVSIDFQDWAWNDPYARCMAKHDAQSVEWLKSSYLNMAMEYVSLGQKMAVMLFGRDIRHVLLLHIGAFDSVMLSSLLDSLQKQGFKFVPLQEAESDPAYQTDPDAALSTGGTLLEQMVESKHLDYPPHADEPLTKLDALCH